MMNAYLFYTPVKRRIKLVWIIHVDSYYLRIDTTIIDIIIIAVHCTIKYDHSSGMAIEILLVFSV